MTIDLEEVKQFVEAQNDGTKVYVGCDSEKFKNKGDLFADYILVVVVHIDGNKGCKIFGEVRRERDYDSKKDKPRLRLMNEVYKVSELYLELAKYIDVEAYDVQVHLDINPDEKWGSSCVINEAIGYVKGVCQITPLVKPKAWAASSAADNFKRVVG